MRHKLKPNTLFINQIYLFMKKLFFLLAIIVMASFGFLSAQNFVLSNQDVTEMRVEAPLQQDVTRGEAILKYINANPTSVLGNSLTGTYYISGCIDFTSAQMANYVGSTLYQISIAVPSTTYMGGLTGYKIWIKGSLSGPVLYEETVNPTVDGTGHWEDFTLGTPQTIMEGSFVIGFTAAFTNSAATNLRPLYISVLADDPYQAGGCNYILGTTPTAHETGASWNQYTTAGNLAIEGYLTNVPTIPANDLAGSLVKADDLKWKGKQSAYAVTVFNAGTAAQNNYTVQLVNDADAVLATQTITASLAAGASTIVNLNYTPAMAGNLIVKGKVILEGDENPTNDMTDPVTFSVYPQQPMAYCSAISDNALGNTQTAYTWHGAIQYPATEMEPFSGKNLTAIELYIAVEPSVVSDCSVWIRSSLTGSNLASQTFTPVQGWNVVPLATPYALTNENTYIGFTYTVSTPGYPMGLTNGNMNANYGGHYATGTNAWTTLSTITNLDANHALIGVVAPLSGDCDPATNLNVVYAEDCSKATLTWDEPAGKSANTVIAPVHQPRQKIEKGERNTIPEMQKYTSNGSPAVYIDDPELDRGTNSDIYFGFGSTTTFYKGTVSDPNGTMLGSAGTNIQATEYVNGTLYGVRYQGGNAFGIVNQATGGLTVIKSNFSNDCVSLCYNPTNGLTYAFAWGSASSSGFGTVDLATGDYFPIGNVPGVFYAAIDNDGICYAIPLSSGSNAPFGTINLATGAFSQITTVPFPTNWVQEMSIDRETNELYWMAANFSTSSYHYYQINKTTGALTTVAAVPSFVTGNVSAYSIATDMPENCDPVTNFNITATGSTVNLIWTSVAGSTGYKIEYDGTELTTVTASSYTHNSVPDGLHTYTVTALFSESCIPLGVTKTIIVGDMCMIRVEMHDSYTDGWEDSHILVTSGGTTYGTLTCPNDAETSVAYVVVPAGTLQFTWVSGSDYDDDASFEIYNSADELIYQCADASTLSGVFFTYENECGGTGPEPGDILYNIYRDGELIVENYTLTTYDDVTADLTTVHFWEVSVVCELGSESNPVGFATEEPCVPPQEDCDPVTDGAAAVTPETAVITWTAVEGATGYKISRDGNVLGTPTEPTFTETAEFVVEESYTWQIVTVCENGESDPFEVSGICVGIKENVQSTFSIKPNPATNNITITADYNFHTIEVLSFLGQIVLSQPNTDNTLDVSNLTNGVYFVRIISENGTNVKKFVKQ